MTIPLLMKLSMTVEYPGTVCTMMCECECEGRLDSRLPSIQ